MREEDRALHDEVVRLSREHGGMVHGIARRYAADEGELDDLVQDIWVRVVEALPRKNPASPIDGWLCAVAANVGHEALRRRQRRARLRQGLPFLASWRSGPDPPAEPMAADTTTRIWRAIDALPALQRRVLLLRVFEGLSTKDAAQVISRKEGTVKVSLHRALKTLGTELADLAALWSGGDL